jgi:hypothetical protein
MSRGYVVLSLLACTLIGGASGLLVAAAEKPAPGDDLHGLVFLYYPVIGAVMGVTLGAIVVLVFAYREDWRSEGR